MSSHSQKLSRHMWTAPIGKRFFDVANDLVGAVICPAC